MNCFLRRQDEKKLDEVHNIKLNKKLKTQQYKTGIRADLD
jgi:hypothetical protein